MENLQHQLIVTPTLVPLSASLTARNRTHAHVAKTGFGLSLVCFSLLDAPVFWFFMLLCFCSFPDPHPDLGIRIRIRFRICIILSTNKNNFQDPYINCFMTS
jgi:hypothetical protein